MQRQATKIDQQIAKLTQEIKDNWISWPRVYIARGTLYLEKEMYLEAMADANEAMANALEPENMFGALYLRGKIYSAQQKYTDAIQDLQMLFSYSDHVSRFDIASVHYHLGFIYEQKKDLGQAISFYAKAISKTYSSQHVWIKQALRKSLLEMKADANLAAITKRELFNAIRLLAEEDTVKLLLQCLHKDTPLGKKMWAQKDGSDIPSIPSVEKGVLKEICDYLIGIDKNYEMMIRNLMTFSPMERISKLTEEIDKSWIKSSQPYVDRALLYFNQKNYDLALADANKALENIDVRNLFDQLEIKFAAYAVSGLSYFYKENYQRAIRNLYRAMPLCSHAGRYTSQYLFDHIFSSFKIALEKGSDFSEITPDLLFDAIKRLAQQDQVPLLLLCLDNETNLGKKMWAKEKENDSEPNITTGILKEICDCLLSIDKHYEMTIKNVIAKKSTPSVATHHATAFANSDKNINKQPDQPLLNITESHLEFGL